MNYVPIEEGNVVIIERPNIYFIRYYIRTFDKWHIVLQNITKEEFDNYKNAGYPVES